MSIISATWKVETGRTWFEATLGKKLDLLSKKKLGVVEHICSPRYTGGIGRRITS
jgi:hypothetical protein